MGFHGKRRKKQIFERFRKGMYGKKQFFFQFGRQNDARYVVYQLRPELEYGKQFC